MIHQPPSALIFMTGRDCEPYVRAALESLAGQTHPAVHVLFVDDCSTDGTGAAAREFLEAHFPGRHSLVRNSEPWGKARNAHTHLRAALPRGDFVAVLDADDALIVPTILSDMAANYAAGFDVVWTNYETDQGHAGTNGALDPFRSPRGQGWKTSHFFSFRSELLANVPEDRFQDEQGAWLPAACDLAIAFPVLDQTRRYSYLPLRAYRYTTTNPASHHNADTESTGLNSRLQKRCAQVVLSKPALPCKRPATEPAAVFQAALGGRFNALSGRLDEAVRQLGQLHASVQAAPFRQLAIESLHRAEGVPLAWLRNVGGWALDAEFLHHLAEVMAHYAKPRVLEFGSGRGTRVLARLCANRGGTLTSIEHNPDWHARTQDDLAEAGLNGTASVRLAPLLDMEFYGVPGRFYNLTCLDETDRFDIVIVDGPPAQTIPLARLPALPAISPYLASGGFHVFLDDYERAEEQQIVDIWREVAPALRFETLAFSKGVCAITAA